MWVIGAIALVGIISFKPIVINKYLVLDDSADRNKTKKLNQYTLNISIAILVCGALIYNALLIDVNTATFKQLCALKGIGKVTATEIIEHRPYEDKAELKELLTEHKYNCIRFKVKVGEDTPA